MDWSNSHGKEAVKLKLIDLLKPFPRGFVFCLYRIEHAGPGFGGLHNLKFVRTIASI
jgi:hypothetical protein